MNLSIDVGDTVVYTDPATKAKKLGFVVDLDRREIPKAYIHFPGQDRRNDCWIREKYLKFYCEGFKSGNSQNDTPLYIEQSEMKVIDRIHISNFVIDAWYSSPYPSEFIDDREIYICDFCLNYYPTASLLAGHCQECKRHRPPGLEIYRDGSVSVFQISGIENKLFCQNLCLLCRLFLEHKNVFYDTEEFDFFVLCHCDEKGAHFAGFFSREKATSVTTLSCIFALPPYQQYGYGHLIIELSYEIARRDCRRGGPERPLSDLGQLAFLAYWRDCIISALKRHPGGFKSWEYLSAITGVASVDLIETAHQIGLIEIKLPNSLCFDNNSVIQVLSKYDRMNRKLTLDPSKLIYGCYSV